MPVIIPEIVVGVSLLSFFALLKIGLGLTTITIAHIAFCISYVIIVVQARLYGFDRTLEEASMDLGANRYKTFFLCDAADDCPGHYQRGLTLFYFIN